MRLSVITLLSCIAAAHALPQVAKRDLDVVCSAESRENENQTSNDSPDLGDCEALRDNIAHSGPWNRFADKIHHELVTHKTCSFGVESKDTATQFKIGNGDVTNMITNSIREYAKNDKVGGKGVIECGKQGESGTVAVTWNIFVPG